MSALVRDAPVGQLVRWVFGKSVLPYPEETMDFVPPASYVSAKQIQSTTTTPGPASPELLDEKLEDPLANLNALTQTITSKDDESGDRASITSNQSLSKIVTRPTMDKVTTRADLEAAYTNASKQETIKQQASRPIVPERTSDGTILVDWYTTDDPENPQNWSAAKKGFVVTQIYLYTLAVYMGSAI